MAVITMIAIVSHAQAQAQNVWIREHEPARKHITEEKLAREIGFLTDSICQGRATGTRGGNEAAFWIHRQFENAGLLKIGRTYSKHVWIGHGLVGHNIMGMFPGSDKQHREKYVIIGAHYDHLGILDGKMYPGADANASGVVALTCLAEMIGIMKVTGRSYDCNMIFVAFDGKEQDMAGSKTLWRQIERGELIDPVSGKAITPDKIEFMVNMDQLGTTMSPVTKGREDFMIMLGNWSLRPIKQDMINICNRFYSMNMDIALSYYGSDNFTKIFYKLSDQKIFVENKIPAVFFTSGITMNTNKTYDSLSSLNLEVLKKRIYLIYHWIDRMI